MHIFLYLVNNAMIALLAWALTFREGEPIHKRLIAMLLAYFVISLEIVIVLGMIKQLRLGSITMLCSLSFMAALIVMRRRRLALPGRASLVSFAAAVGRVFNRSNTYIKSIAFLILATFIVKFINVFLLIPYGFDGTWYHLPNLVDYIQNGMIYLCEKPVWSNCYPKSVEMHNLWQLIHLRNGLTLSITQYLFTLLGGVGLYGILRDEKVKPEYSFLGALLYWSTPIILAQINSHYVDSSLSAVFVVTAYFLNGYLKRGLTIDLIYFSLALGVLLGIKYFSIAYYAIFIMALAGIMFAQKKSVRVVTASLLLAGTISVAVGGGVVYYQLCQFRQPCLSV